MKSYTAIILAVSVILIVYFLYLFFIKSTTSFLLSSPVYFLDQSGNKGQIDQKVKSTIIQPDLIKNVSSSNYAISCWFCVNNWTDTTSATGGNGKTIYALLSSSNSYNPSIFKAKDINAMPHPIFPWNRVDNSYASLYCDSSSDNVYYMLCLDSVKPNLYFSIRSGSHCYPIFITNNFPAQKWTNVIISMEGAILDAYIDGKMVQSGQIAYLDSSGNTNPLIPDRISNPSSLIVGNPDENKVDLGVTRLVFYDKAIDPQTAQTIYNAGSGVNPNTTKFDVYISKDNNIIQNVNVV